MKYMLQNLKTQEIIQIRFKTALEAAIAQNDLDNPKDWEIICCIVASTPAQIRTNAA